ncbi:hypothetical protein CMV_008333 [Castanea mollissima]|uniref:Uncharacterized protein n=1 Tax=Castanea mollissima TaxID=60419 RepID=A0A8J4R8R3_9ROSI|nr:hypothetical protein CMV_008333 [Castanea mollissima]
MFPQLSRVACVMELNKSRAKKPVEVGSSYSMEWESLARDHRVYATLAQVCTSFLVEDCISEAISASSTDHYPLESIHNTLLPAYTWRDPYWSSKGQSDPAVPETLIYKLKSELCVISEINICPFQELFLSSLYIYSANSVRFRMGHPKGPNDFGSHHLGDSLPCNAEDTFIWTYTSPEFPMAQEGCFRILGFQNLFSALVEFCRLSCWVGASFIPPPSLPKDEAHEISDDQLQRGFTYWQHFVIILEGNKMPNSLMNMNLVKRKMKQRSVSML